MPMIIDANRGSDFSTHNHLHARHIVLSVMKRKIKVSVGGKLLEELMKTPLRDLLAQWEKAGFVQKVSNESINVQTKILYGEPMRSNDIHVIALARACHARLLYSDDNALIDDFKDLALVQPKGAVIKQSTPMPDVITLMYRHAG